MTSCPCPGQACDDVHAHDVTAAFTVTLPPLEQLLGRLAPDPGGIADGE